MLGSAGSHLFRRVEICIQLVCACVCALCLCVCAGIFACVCAFVRARVRTRVCLPARVHVALAYGASEEALAAVTAGCPVVLPGRLVPTDDPLSLSLSPSMCLTHK